MTAEEPDVDLDEDLFAFDEVMPDETDEIAESIDLEAIFTAFGEQEPAGEVAADAEGEDDGEDEDEGSGDALDDLDELFESVEPSRAAAEPPRPKPAPAAPPAAAREAAPAQAAPAPAAPPPAPLPAAEAPAVPAASVRPATGVRRRRSRATDAPPESRPAAAPERPASGRAAAFLTRGTLAVLLAMTLLNVSIAVVTFSNASGMKNELASASREMAEAAGEIRETVGEQAVAVRERFAPVVPIAPEDHPTLDRAEADVEAGRFADARRRIYSLLAVADRLPDASRQELEARAAFLIARSYHAEALAAGGRR